MAIEIKKAEYFNITIDSRSVEAYRLLAGFANLGISLLAFRAVPVKQNQTQFSLFPDDSSGMIDGAKRMGLNLNGPFTALIIKSNNSDEPGECAEIFRRLSQVGINEFESSGIADIKDSYGVILYMKHDDCDKALSALQV